MSNHSRVYVPISSDLRPPTCGGESFIGKRPRARRGTPVVGDGLVMSRPSPATPPFYADATAAELLAERDRLLVKLGAPGVVQ